MKYLFPLLTFLPALAFAQPTPIPEPEIESVPELLAAMKTIAAWIFAIFLIVATIFFLLAAFQYLTSKGGEGVKKAHAMLIYGAVAVAVAVLAPGLVNIVISLVSR